MNTKKLWWRGLVAAAVGGATGGFMSMVVDPSHFNLFGGGFKPLAEMAVTNALVAAVMYLKQHPLPDADELAVIALKVEQKEAAKTDAAGIV